MNEIVYMSRYHNRADRSIVGTQVGRFAVRAALPRESRHALGGGECPVLPFIVDHIPSGVGVADFDTYEDALRFADEISRACPIDPDTADPWRLRGQLGPDVLAWIDNCELTGTVIRFRDFIAERDAAQQQQGEGA